LEVSGDLAGTTHQSPDSLARQRVSDPDKSGKNKNAGIFPDQMEEPLRFDLLDGGTGRDVEGAGHARENEGLCVVSDTLEGMFEIDKTGGRFFQGN
jgi:hypothetical protein